MPCRSDYQDPTGQELESKRVCSLLVYLHRRLELKIPQWIHDAAASDYGNLARLDEATRLLCATCRSLTEAQVEEVIYDARNAKARKLASWWERHQEWDRRRLEEEQKARNQERIRREVLKKLTPEEIRALGLS
ncbi:MAG: hypothetical protein ACYTG0_42475 [Planctomycetota bacterium]|jgi:hypothetical protein